MCVCVCVCLCVVDVDVMAYAINGVEGGRRTFIWTAQPDVCPIGGRQIPNHKLLRVFTKADLGVPPRHLAVPRADPVVVRPPDAHAGGFESILPVFQLSLHADHLQARGHPIAFFDRHHLEFGGAHLEHRVEHKRPLQAQSERLLAVHGTPRR